MTIESSITKVKREGNNSTFTFSFSPMVIYKTTDLVVVLTDLSGVDTTLTEGTGPTNYSVQAVAGSSYPSALGATGSITYPADSSTPLPFNSFLTIKRVLPFEQKTDLETQGGYFPDVQETALDKLLVIDLQQQEDLDRSIKGPITDDNPLGELPNVNTRKSKFLAFDASGNPIAATTVTTAPVSSFMELLLDDTTDAAARITIDAQEDVITTRGDIVVGDTLGDASRLAVGAANNVLRSDGTDPSWGQVQTADIADDAVTLAKIAAGTDGELITWDASGNPAAVATGTANQVLKSNGAGAAPTFQVDPTEWVFVETLTTTSGATHTFTQDNQYASASEILLLFQSVSGTTNPIRFHLTLYESGVEKTGANDYVHATTSAAFWPFGDWSSVASTVAGIIRLRKIPVINQYQAEAKLISDSGTLATVFDAQYATNVSGGFSDMDQMKFGLAFGTYDAGSISSYVRG